MEVKQCTKCGETKPLDAFGMDCTKPDGHRPRCKECRRIEKRKPQEREPEPMQLAGEHWRDIPGHEGYYQVSDMGRVRSVDRYILVQGGVERMCLGSIIRATHNGGQRRYLRVCLYGVSENAFTYVHRLVALAFIGDASPEHHVHHINGISTDNRPCNLAYVPKAAHLSEHNRGEKNNRATLSERDVVNIRKLLAGHHAGADVARLFGVRRNVIYDIRHGRTWKHVAMGDAR